MKYDSTYSSFRKIAAGIPQNSVLGPMLYLLYIDDIPKTSGVKVATFADYTAILATEDDNISSTRKLQRNIDPIVD